MLRSISIIFTYSCTALNSAALPASRLLSALQGLLAIICLLVLTAQYHNLIRVILLHEKLHIFTLPNNFYICIFQYRNLLKPKIYHSLFWKQKFSQLGDSQSFFIAHVIFIGLWKYRSLLTNQSARIIQVILLFSIMKLHLKWHCNNTSRQPENQSGLRQHNSAANFCNP